MNVKSSEQLIILGNGFDIASTLPSTYNQYFKSREEVVYDLDEIEDIFFDNYSGGQSVFDILSKINEMIENEQSDDESTSSQNKYDDYFLMYKKIQQLKILYEFSFWEISSVVGRRTLFSWNGIEKAIENFIKKFNKDYGNINDNFKMMKRVISDFGCLYPEGVSFDFKTKHDDENKTSEFYIFVIACILKAKYNTKNLFDAIRKFDTFQSFFMDELNDFESRFVKYIKYVSEDKKYLNQRDLLFKQISSDGTDEKDGIHNKSMCKLLSFNYTDYSSLSNNVNDIHNIHGSVNGNHIIFGIDSIYSSRNDEKNEKDEENNNYKEHIVKLKPFTKTYRLLELETDYTVNSVLTNDIKLIKFFGHSLSHADYSYFQSIFDYYDVYSNNIKLIFYFALHDGESDTEKQIIKSKRKQISKVYNLMEDYGKTMDNADHGKNLLHKLIMEGRLSIRRVKSPEELQKIKNVNN